MPKENTRGALPASILSLLVAADQCCPAIIGQAHLLYHAGMGINPEQAARTFTQLKKDADDLCKSHRRRRSRPESNWGDSAWRDGTRQGRSDDRARPATFAPC